MKYTLMEPPFEHRPFAEMSKEEAKRFFDWYVEQIPSRMKLLSLAFQMTGGGDRDQLDFSPASLKALWEWFLKQIEWSPKPKEVFDAEYEKANGFIKRKMLSRKVYQYELSTGSLAIGMDIAMYLGEVFVRNHEALSWGYSIAERFADRNQPIIVGFPHDYSMNPRDNVHGLMIKALEDEAHGGDELFKTYERLIHL
ncbi:hypothetical protein [Paenibacillus soyae]|uniref:Uncharacterized protein n=1 Tax=Paenibacillus soyae TaxID=2969249 RepID=A0A9X2MMX7_9BACL|nr:hypothetical protein [Paenibacillus soyae]MCR2803636.1 hypothetical protein [Paenibacillus soyae]